MRRPLSGGEVVGGRALACAAPFTLAIPSAASGMKPCSHETVPWSRARRRPSVGPLASPPSGDGGAGPIRFRIPVSMCLCDAILRPDARESGPHELFCPFLGNSCFLYYAHELGEKKNLRKSDDIRRFVGKSFRGRLTSLAPGSCLALGYGYHPAAGRG